MFPFVRSNRQLSKYDLESEQAKGIHFIVKKPWEIWYREIVDATTVDIEDARTGFLTHSEPQRLVSQWRRDQFVAERGRFDAARGVRRERRKRRHKIIKIAIAVGGAVAIFVGGVLLGRLL